MQTFDQIRLSLNALADLKVRKARLDAEISSVMTRAAEHEAARAEFQGGDPENAGQVRRLSEAHIKAELYANKLSELKRLERSLIGECELAVKALAKDLGGIARASGHGSKSKFLAGIAAQVLNGEEEIRLATMWFKTHGERRADLLEGQSRDSVDTMRTHGPFREIDLLAAAWADFERGEPQSGEPAAS